MDINILQGDCIESLKKLEDQSINTCIKIHLIVDGVILQLFHGIGLAWSYKLRSLGSKSQCNNEKTH